ncbi:MAG: UDP-N-acetylglucosamine--N-acetylmuramyl-(pentapeptide) pyrophosphoryl-undecaprenol N-acetylglucosamine transferase [Candidatus Gracilibacteria bacterium]|nr:UDP-N-acetylglucosamine--N-acetylmuramyl-(pentapeptide) pyrophosphoryl-undecaprenol N-acetylglucosamine transferase [Candidatus Gracilibacteria bacterium]
MTKIKIALTGGGTGGHVFPLLSVYNHLKNENLDFVWIGEKNSLEQKIALENNIEFHSIMSGKIRRYFDLKNFFDPFKIIFGVFQSLYYIVKYDINIIFSKGGFVSVPACIAGKILGKKIYIHESDTVMGLSNKIIARLATKVFFTFDNSLIDGKKYIKSSQILNPKLIENIQDKLEKNEKQEILVMAGSQGSKIIFENLLEIIGEFPNTNFTIILGEKNTSFRKNFEKFPNTKLYDFISQEELATVMQKADISITRAGATSIWEQYYFGIIQIIIPLKNSAGNHQFHNAMYFQKHFDSIVLEESENLGNNLKLELEKLENYRKEKLNLSRFSDGLEVIKKEIL